MTEAETQVATERWWRDALPRNTDLFGYKIVGALGRGGFGITYRAVDRIDQVFAIKECYPKQFAVREGTAVFPADDSEAEIFAECLDRFTKEARALTLFSKNAAAGDGVVKVITSFEANNTAYIVMDFLDGQSLESLILDNPQGLPEAKIEFILRKLLTALACVHDNKLLHRDIKPANILLRADGSPVLLDFGAARVVQPGGSGQYSQIFTEAYAPIEQISGHAQGPYSDLYALGATCYNMVIGAKFRGAAAASRRASELATHKPDPLVPAEVAGAGRYSPVLLRAIDLLMRVSPEKRPQSVADFLPYLQEGADTTVAVFKPAAPVVDTAIDTDATRMVPAPSGASAPTQMPTGQFRATDDAASQPTQYAPGQQGTSQFPAPVANKQSGGMAIILATAAIVVLALAGGAYWLSQNKDQDMPVTAVAASTPPSSTSNPTAAPVTDTDADKAYKAADYPTALRAYQTAAQGGDARAQYQLGYMSEYGQGMTQDYAAAFHWYSLAAAQNLKTAQFRLGYLYQNGFGQTKSIQTALHWYQLAAAQGSAPASTQLGYIYMNGIEVPRNYPEALRWYSAAADLGLPAAQYNVGRIYAEGLGVPVDLLKARQWMNKAAAGGDGEARRWVATH